MHQWINPTPSEMEMDFLTRFVPLQVTKDVKIEKLERGLKDIVAIKRDHTVVEKDFDHSRTLVVGGNDDGNRQGIHFLVESETIYFKFF